MRISPVLPLLVVITATLTACDHHTDSIARLNEIPFGGTNDANIAAMVVNPTDLLHGRGLASADGAVASLPVQAVETDRAKPLLNAGPATTGGKGG